MTPIRAAAKETIKFHAVTMGSPDLHNFFLVFEEDKNETEVQPTLTLILMVVSL